MKMRGTFVEDEVVTHFSACAASNPSYRPCKSPLSGEDPLQLACASPGVPAPSGCLPASAAALQPAASPPTDI